MFKYTKPSIVDLSAFKGKPIAPLAPGLALAGGYMIGKAIKDSRVTDAPLKNLAPVMQNATPVVI